MIPVMSVPAAAISPLVVEMRSFATDAYVNLSFNVALFLAKSSQKKKTKKQKNKINDIENSKTCL